MGEFSPAQLVAKLMLLCTRNSSQFRNTTEQGMSETPLPSSSKKPIGPLLDAIDGLRCLNMNNIEIQIPSIVVIGDQSSGKSSVLESLARVNIPKGKSMCTRMPLVIQMKDHSLPNLEMELVFGKEKWRVSEDSVEQEIKKISEQNALNGISDKEINLIISRKGMPNLTLIDLPGITRVAVDGQPDDIEKQIHGLIKKYIWKKDCIILNVLPASVDFSTCESIKMSRKVDNEGKRTLAVVTKADQNQGDLETTITENRVKIGLGYVCVRNSLDGETHEEARKEEEKLFGSPPLSTIDRKMVGIPMLLSKLLEIQDKLIQEFLPDIATNVKVKLSESIIELNKLSIFPENAKSEFNNLMNKLIKSLERLLVRGEFQEYPNDNQLHGTARIRKKIEEFYEDLNKEYPDPVLQGQASTSQAATDDALPKEFYQLKETQGPWLPCILPRNAFITLLHLRVNQVAELPKKFMDEVWEDVKGVVEEVIAKKFCPYPQMSTMVKKAAENVLMKKKDLSFQQMSKMVEMEKHIDYTCNPEYSNKLEELMSMKELKDSFRNAHASNSSAASIEMHDEAFKLHIKLAAYWRIVVMRMVDVSAMHLLMSIKQLIDEELKSGIMEEVLVKNEQGIEKMMIETPEITKKKEELEDRIQRLERAQKMVAQYLPK